MKVTDEYNLFCQGKLPDPYPFYHLLRREDPVHFSDQVNSWILTRFDDVAAVLHYSPDTSSDRVTAYFSNVPRDILAKSRSLLNLLSQEMLLKDPPHHTRLRMLVNKTFTPRTIERMRPRAETIVHELIDSVFASGRMEAIRDFAYPLPMRVICRMLGLPAEHQAQFKQWSDDIAKFMDGVSDDYEDVAARARRSVSALKDYFRRMVGQRRRQPQEDLITALALVEEEGDKLSEDELFAMYILLLFAGHETTTGLIGNGLLALLRHPEQLERLRTDPALVPSAVEEMLRYDNSIQRMTRMAARDFQINGKQIRKGQWVWAMVGAANRDPAHFADPDRFDICREPNKHIAFGYGIHFCLGAALARMEAQAAFEILLRRLPAIRLAADTNQWRPSVSLRVLESLSIAFD